MKVSIQDALRAVARKLPSGSTLTYTVQPDHLWLEVLRLPPSARGVGSKVLAQVLDLADRAGLPVALVADPTDEPGDPSTVDLVAWYQRFGFKALSATEDGVAMERPVRRPAAGVDAVLNDAKAAKKGESRATLEALQEAVERLRGGPLPVDRVAPLPDGPNGFTVHALRRGP